MSENCPRCGSTSSEPLMVLCPRCLLEGGLEHVLEESPEEKPPPCMGDYELLEPLSRGGMGIVYRARHRVLGRTVALKMLAVGEHAGPVALYRFQAEVEAAAQLSHPHIVPIFDVGEHEGRAFFTMPLMEGGSLADRLEAFREPRRAAEVVSTLSRAVHYGHQRGILHRDLKPANVLLDLEGRPYIADFGVARRLGQEQARTESNVIVGTPGYMAPEQAAGGGQGITTATDVYGLGAILYEMLTGRPPFEARTALEVLDLVRDVEPLSPRVLAPRLDKDLETICLKCLEKEPERRYGSAEELASDLDRYLQGEPVTARPLGRVVRSLRWARRHPTRASLYFTLLWLMTVSLVAAPATARVQLQARQTEELRETEDAARSLAKTALLFLEKAGQAVRLTATEPTLAALISRPEPEALRAYCRSAFLRYESPRGGLRAPGGPSPFENWVIHDTRGNVLARWPPPPPDYLRKPFAFRDYFKGAERMAREGRHEVHVSRAFVSEADSQYRIALSTPIYGPDGAWLGVLTGMLGTGRALGSLRSSDMNGGQRIGLLVAPRDHSRGEEGPSPRDILVLLHDHLAEGGGSPLAEGELAERLKDLAGASPESTDDGDPLRLPALWPTLATPRHSDAFVGGKERLLAAYAPVGYTGLGVILETPAKAATALDRQLGHRVLLWCFGPFFAGELLVVVMLRLSGTRWGGRAG